MSRPSNSPPRWLLMVLTLSLAAVMVVLLTRSSQAPTEAAATPQSTPSAQTTTQPAPAPTPTPTPEPTPPPEPTPTPLPPYDYTHALPEGEPVDQAEWFADAVFIGDSRTDGLHLYSGITPEADFLYSTGLTVFEVVRGEKVIRQGDKKISILDALGQKEYGKVYICLGINELGGYDPEGFAETYGQLIDTIRELQPDARLYVQSIVPVNTAKCKAYEQRYYVTNENINSYNSALAQLVIAKKVPFVDLAPALTEDSGEVPYDLSSDGVHFKKEGYQIWLDYLTCHTALEFDLQ